MIAKIDIPLPIDQLLQRSVDVRYSSTNLTSSYRQIPVEGKSQKFTTFMFNRISYKFNMFELKTAMTSFSQCIDLVLGPQVREFVVNYVDDLLIVLHTFSEHQKHLTNLTP